jgi:hypothetical protein
VPETVFMLSSVFRDQEVVSSLFFRQATFTTGEGLFTGIRDGSLITDWNKSSKNFTTVIRTKIGVRTKTVRGYSIADGQ